VGNLLSIRFALERVGLKTNIVPSPAGLKGADAIVMPGVGNFSAIVRTLKLFRSEILELTRNGVPLLGLCLGMQLFFPGSEEGAGNGLSLFQGKVSRLPNSVKTPHMGWNTLHVVKENELLRGVEEGSWVYFVHSYYPIPLDKDLTVTETTYGVTFASAIARGNVYGTQFHPEKSGETGSAILKNFVEIVKR